MAVSEKQVEKLITKYYYCIDYIINHNYCRADRQTRSELEQTGLIGLWKGINAYYSKHFPPFDEKIFIDTVFAYIRYEISNCFRNENIIKISGRQWKKLSEIRKTNKDTFCISDGGNIKQSQYYELLNALNIVSLDAKSDNTETGKYDVIPCYDAEIQNCSDNNYALYIITSAMAGVASKRDKHLISCWLDSIYRGKELKRSQLAKIYGISASAAGKAINRFIDICRFVRDCENVYSDSVNGFIYFPDVKIPAADHTAAESNARCVKCFEGAVAQCTEHIKRKKYSK